MADPQQQFSLKEPELLERLHPLLANSPLFGGALRGVRYDRLCSSRTKPAVLVGLDFGDHRPRQVFVKEFPLAHRDNYHREVRLYQDFLARADLGTAACIGTLEDQGCGTSWLVLEAIRAKPCQTLQRHEWLAAATWLARFQRWFARDPLAARGLDFLSRYDNTYYELIAHQALTRTRRMSPAGARRLTRVLDGFDRVTTWLLRDPRVIVHGAFGLRAHGMVDRDAPKLRVVPVDWETCGYAHVLTDLVTLADSLTASGATCTNSGELEEAYAEAAQHEQLTLPPREEWGPLQIAARIHRSLLRLRKLAKAGSGATDLEQRITAIETWYDQL